MQKKIQGHSVGADRKTIRKPVAEKKSLCSKTAEDAQEIGVKHTLLFFTG